MSFTAPDHGLPTIHQHPLAYLLGVQGVALMKAFAGEFDADFTAARIAEVRRLLDAAEALGPGVDVPPMATHRAYDGWAPTYDDPGNGIFAIEEPPVRALLDGFPVGVAVDAACGTGRHAAYLTARGHTVHGFDTSPAMLALARDKVPCATFAEADLRSLPVPAGSADLVVCALALAHVEDLASVFAEFARVLRPGGHVVVSDTRGHFTGSRLYPLVKWDVDDRCGYIPTWRHTTSEYLEAALPHGFLVRHCHEQMRGGPMTDAEAEPEPRSTEYPDDPPDIWSLHTWAPAATNAAYRDAPSLLVWDFELDERRHHVG